MHGKAFFFLVLLILAAVLPYLLADDRWLADAEAWFTKTKTTLASDAGGSRPATFETPLPPPATRTQSAAIVAEGPATIYGTKPASLQSVDAVNATAEASLAEFGLPAGRKLDVPHLLGPPVLPLEHLLSFNVTPEWISGNWQRVTTRVAELDLQGWRVPIAIGSGPQTIAGSTTYFFDSHRQLQRIMLHGYAADPSELINLAASRFQMRRIPSPTDDLYTASVEGRTIGALRVKYAPVAESASEKRSEVLMELNRQGTSYGMSQELSRLLEQTAEELRLLDPRSLQGGPTASSG